MSDTLVTPGAGTSYSSRAKEFVELHDQVQTSVNLLDTLSSFLSTFQHDLSAVSGQISDLQSKSTEIDQRLKSRRKVEKPLADLISDITISTETTRLILDSPVNEHWTEKIAEFERQLDLGKARSRVKAARDVGEVAEGLRIVATTKIRQFFLSLFQPVAKSITVNMLVLQSGILRKYRPLFTFLQRQSPNVATELQKTYIGIARTYYEVGFRRYLRALTWIKSRTVEKFEPMATASGTVIDNARLAYGLVEGPTVTLAFLADNKTYTESPESLFRSALLVFMDNASAEYAFLASFFALESALPLPSSESLLSPQSIASPLGSDYTPPPASISAALFDAKEQQNAADMLWKQVWDPVLTYLQNFAKSIFEPTPPPLVSLLTMIRLTEDVASELESRRCPPAVSFIFGLRMNLWPVFQTCMSQNIDSVAKLAAGGGGYFSRAAPLTDVRVSVVTRQFVSLFNAFVALTQQGEETMIFQNLLRLRQEVVKLIQRYAEQLTEPSQQLITLAKTYDSVLQGLTNDNQYAAHPKCQQEMAFWSKLEEEARRKMIVQQSR